MLASVHGVDWDGRWADASERGVLTAENADTFFRQYLGEVSALVASDFDFEVLAHLDYPARYWPVGVAYEPSAYEEELRAILNALAQRDVVLEINTTRGRCLCPSPTILAWWREEGGRAVSFASDAHRPEHLATGFDAARDVAEAAGFKAAEDPNGFWIL